MTNRVTFQNKLSPVHNHQLCINRAMQNADAYCQENNIRLTTLRKKVLRYIWESHIPSAAYDILSKLSIDGYNASPPTVYRSLDFLIQHHMVHKIASLNAYIGCQSPGHHHSAQFFICKQCGVATELEDKHISHRIESDSQQLGFAIAQQTVEISGICHACNNAQ